MVSIGYPNDGVAVDPAGIITVARLDKRVVTIDRFLPDGRGCSGESAHREIAIDDRVRLMDSVAIGPAGELIVLDNRQIGGYVLWRCHPDGTLDPSFGADGQVEGSFGDPSLPNRSAAAFVGVSSDGSILVAGNTGDRVPQGAMVGVDPEATMFAVARFHADGTADQAFGKGGLLTATVGPGQDSAFSIAFNAAGWIAVAGQTGYMTPGPFDNDVAVLLVDAAGRPSETFGPIGTAHAHVPGTIANSGRAIAVAPDGRIVVVPWIEGAPLAAIGRFLAHGAVDSSMGKGGFRTYTDLPSFVGLAVQPDSRIVVSMNDGRLARINDDGTLDLTFGSGGMTVKP
jgi:uncharacterized delta-60 repeat protein